MAGKSNIEWTGHSWNPLAGCTVLTPGCSSCYAMKLAPRLARMGQPLYEGLTKETKGGAVWTGEIRRAAESVLLAPLKRKKPTTYFVNSMSDLFHENVPDEWIDAIFAVMALCPQHTFQVLTKRAGRMRSYMLERWQPSKGMLVDLGGGDQIAIPAESEGANRRSQIEGAMAELIDGDAQLKKRFLDTENDDQWTAEGDSKCTKFAWPLPNVWLGVSTEDQKRADERIPLLLQTPAAIRFISAEPLLGPINLNSWPDRSYLRTIGDDGAAVRPGLDWVIVGGESGHGFRKMDPAWAEGILAQCKSAGTAVFMKQMSGRAPIPPLMQIRQFPETLTR